MHKSHALTSGTNGAVGGISSSITTTSSMITWLCGMSYALMFWCHVKGAVVKTLCIRSISFLSFFVVVIVDREFGFKAVDRRLDRNDEYILLL